MAFIDSCLRLGLKLMLITFSGVALGSLLLAFENFLKRDRDWGKKNLSMACQIVIWAVFIAGIYCSNSG